MTRACQELEVLLSLHAAGALEGAEAASVKAHLAGCAACRSAVARDREVLDLARLPPVAEAERRALHDLAGRTRQGLRRREIHRGLYRRVAVGMAAAAAVVLALVSPALLHSGSQLSDPGAPPAAGAVSAVAWQEPDAARLWEESAVLDLEPAASRDGLVMDAALAALDDGVGE